MIKGLGFIRKKLGYKGFRVYRGFGFKGLCDGFGFRVYALTLGLADEVLGLQGLCHKVRAVGF